MGKRLFFSTLVIVLLTLILSIVSVNLVFRSQFANYIAQANATMLKQLPSRLSALYLGNGNWSTTGLQEFAGELPMDVYITLKDPKGNVIASLTNPMNSMHAQGNMMNMMGGQMGVNNPGQQWTAKEFQVMGTQGLIATAQVRYPSSTRILNPQDQSFAAAIFRSLIVAGILALLLGALLSYVMSKRLVAPLRTLTAAAKRIGAGNLDEHVVNTGKDEIGWLATAFNEMADNLNRQEKLRKQFMADITHELRTPLTSIRSYIEAFQDGVLPADWENLSSINEEIDRLVGLVSDLKDLNIAEMGETAVSRQPVDVVRVVNKVIRNLSPLIQDKHLVIDFAHAETTAEISGDEQLLTRLFYNLIHNSYKYTEQGGHIGIELTALNEAVQVKVRDTGIGIPAADLPYIFERFFRTDRSRTRETGGSGIGLALVKQIVTLHAGSISAESEVGRGSVFTVTLPFSQEIHKSFI